MDATQTAQRKVEQVLAQLETLPPMAPVVTRILALTEDPQHRIRDLAQLVASDPSLTARVLSVCGKASVAARPCGLTAETAVGLLGFDAIRRITLASKVMEVFGVPRDPGDGPGLDREAFWRHCLAVACAARRIAESCAAGIDAEEAFLFGLLHDIGKIALDCALPKSYARVLRHCREARAEITDSERTILGVDHTVAGRHLAERWGLPPRLAEVIWLHHHPSEALPASVSRGRHVQVVQLADTMARELRMGFSGSERVTVSSAELAAGLGLEAARREEILATLAEELESRSAWIGSEQTTSREVYLRALLRTSEDLTEANALLGEQNQHLQRKGRYFAAMDGFHRSCAPGLAVREVCALGAEALREVLGHEVEASGDVVVFVTSEDGRWVDLGIGGDRAESRMEERPADAPDETADAATALSMGLCGAWLSPAGRGFDWIVDRVRGELGAGPVWLMPIVCRQRWVGGALAARSAEFVASIRAESAELGALSGAIGLAIAQAQAQAGARQLADELAAANRRLAELGPELARARALETIAAMAAGAAHELNNPLAVISGRAQLLAGQTENADVRRELGMVASQAQACSDIVTELMEFASPRPLVPEAVDLSELLGSLRAELAEAGLLDASQLAVEVGTGCPAAWFDKARLHAILRELIDNALAATEATERRTTVKAEGNLTEDSVVVLVTDTGRGMTAEVLRRAFDPFYSHHPAGRRRGLGLSKVQRWLQQGGGMIRLESEPGAGTRAEVRLPAIRSGGRGVPK